jgi:hypothetical protein
MVENPLCRMRWIANGNSSPHTPPLQGHVFNLAAKPPELAAALKTLPDESRRTGRGVPRLGDK